LKLLHEDQSIFSTRPFFDERCCRREKKHSPSYFVKTAVLYCAFENRARVGNGFVSNKCGRSRENRRRRRGRRRRRWWTARCKA